MKASEEQLLKWCGLIIGACDPWERALVVEKVAREMYSMANAPEPSAWIKTAGRPPTKEDADEDGRVASWCGVLVLVHWTGVKELPLTYTHWQPVPDCLKAPEAE